jgi:pilus assembly protein Flp/PilA
VLRRITRQRAARDRGSSAVEFSLMVAAMAAMILAVVLGVGHVVGEIFFHGCAQFQSQLAGSGQCVAPDAGDGQGQAPAGQSADDSRRAPGANDLGSSSDDM